MVILDPKKKLFDLEGEFLMEFQNILPQMAKIHHKQNPSGSAIPLYVTIYIYIYFYCKICFVT